MPTARLKAELPGGPAALSAERPDDEFRILAAYPTHDGLLGILEVRTSDVDAVRDLFAGSPRFPTHEVLHADDRTLLVQYAVPFVPPPFRAVLASGNLPRFPLTVRDGCVIAEITTSHERLAQLQAEFDAAGIPYEVLSVTQSSDPTEVLTDRQRQFVSEAIERGYYDTPRRCSLTDLADALGTSKSTASVVLHGAEERIVKSFVGEQFE